MAGAVVLGTPGPTGATSERLFAELPRLAFAEVDDTHRLPGPAAGTAGFFGARSGERLPTEVAITENMKRFKRIARAATAS